ncbi:MAG: hypothetical protein ABI886_05205 [Betaproteobacteria bacterium]
MSCQRAFRRHAPVATPARQRGVVLFVALIVMVALSLAGIALVRSVETATLVAGNLAFRQGSVPVSTSAVEKSTVDLFEGPAKGIGILKKDEDDTSKNYYAAWKRTDDQYGIPKPLQGDLSGYPVDAQKITDTATGNTARYIIERMCLNTAPAYADKFAPPNKYCDLMPPKQTLGTTTGELIKVALPRIPFYRVTIRVDGPNNTVAFSQATLR